MTWDAWLDALVADLEQQADGLALAARDEAVAELSSAEYAEVDLVSRLLASLGRPLRCEVRGVGTVSGDLTRVGDGWFLLDGGAAQWAVRTGALDGLRGLSPRAVPTTARPVGARLGLGSALRGILAAREPVVLHRQDESTLRGRLVRVGADFVELVAGEAEPAGLGDRSTSWSRSYHAEVAWVVPFDALAAVSTR